MTTSREVREGRQLQGAEEIISYKITTTPWASGPSSAVVKAYDITNNTKVDVTATVLSGAVGIVDDIITLPPMLSLTVGKWYRVEVKFYSGGNTYELYFIVVGED